MTTNATNHDQDHVSKNSAPFPAASVVRSLRMTRRGQNDSWPEHGAGQRPAPPRERSAELAVLAITAGLSPSAAGALLDEVAAFARVYRGASEALWIGERSRTNTRVDDPESRAQMCLGAKGMLRAAARLLERHRMAGPMAQVFHALFGAGPDEVAEQLGTTDGASEGRSVRLALRVCRRVIGQFALAA